MYQSLGGDRANYLIAVRVKCDDSLSNQRVTRAIKPFFARGNRIVISQFGLRGVDFGCLLSNLIEGLLTNLHNWAVPLSYSDFEIIDAHDPIRRQIHLS
jgi:hypothetical protein